MVPRGNYFVFKRANQEVCLTQAKQPVMVGDPFGSAKMADIATASPYLKRKLPGYRKKVTGSLEQEVCLTQAKQPVTVGNPFGSAKKETSPLLAHTRVQTKGDETAPKHQIPSVFCQIPCQHL